MMKTEMEYKCRVINGQELYFPTKSQWREIFDAKCFMGVAVASRLLFRLQDDNVPLSLEYESIEMGLGFFGLKSNVLPYPILEKDGFSQRVYLEKVKCRHCDWVGSVANPFVMDVYLGVSSEESVQSLMQDARKNFEKMNCPKCSIEFDRYFIWVDDLSL